MLDKLNEAEQKYIRLEASLADPAVCSDIERYTTLMK